MMNADRGKAKWTRNQEPLPGLSCSPATAAAVGLGVYK